MTTTQRKPSLQQVQLAPNQIYVKRPSCPDPIQTLIEGCPNWSYVEHAFIQQTSLYYQGRYILSLKQKDGLYEKDDVPQEKTPERYHTLPEAVQAYRRQNGYFLSLMERLNQEDGLKEWCFTQSFTTTRLALQLTLPLSIRQRLQRVTDAAPFSGGMEEIITSALYARLSELEQRYCTLSTPVEEQA